MASELSLQQKVIVSNCITYLKETTNATDFSNLFSAEETNAFNVTQSHSVADIFQAGMKSLGIEMPSDDDSKASVIDKSATDPIVLKNPAMWKKWVDKLNSKGYFGDGNAPGSDEYNRRLNKALDKYKDKMSSKISSDESSNTLSNEERESRAEACKADGNSKMAAADYDAAIKCYRDALQLSPSGPSSHIYYANLAAALTHVSDYNAVIEACEVAIALKPSYAKSYSRMGYAQLQAKDTEAAIQSYRRGLEVDPENQACIAGLEEAENATVATTTTASTRSSAPASGGGMPDLSALAGMMGGGANGGGGMPDLSALAGMMGGGAGGAGGLAGLMNNPQIQSMMQNPAMMQMAQNMMANNPDMMANMMRGAGQGEAKKDDE